MSSAACSRGSAAERSRPPATLRMGLEHEGGHQRLQGSRARANTKRVARGPDRLRKRVAGALLAGGAKRRTRGNSEGPPTRPRASTQPEAADPEHREEARRVMVALFGELGQDHR